MPVAEIVEALSKWFDVSRYDALKNLTLEQICGTGKAHVCLQSQTAMGNTG